MISGRELVPVIIQPVDWHGRLYEKRAKKKFSLPVGLEISGASDEAKVATYSLSHHCAGSY
jgi:hypothetical protein